ncbi:MAG: hypothetical protein HY873_09425 [Chloroflexi bacterium]|nr:hypothetical protein [Chloroflexota bacterium]
MAIDEVLGSLAETIAWCTQHADLADPEQSLRSKELSPYPVDDKRVFNYANDDLCNRPKETVLITVTARSLIVGHEELRSLAGGRLAGYQPTETLWSGAAKINSNGFLDEFDAPPWDTWVASVVETRRGDPRLIRSEYVLAWIPPEFLELVAKGMFANDSDCTWWLDEHDTTLGRLLAERGVM